MENTPDSNSLQYALQVALQTMKERCVALQKRVSTLEEENKKLRTTSKDTLHANTEPNLAAGAKEVLQFRLQLAELQRQKTQLSEHVNMISQENRNLWSRLSDMAKEQEKNCIAKQNYSSEIAQQRQQQQQQAANQNLIRSKTFTQHSPNPNLRHRLISADIVENMEDISLSDQWTGSDSGVAPESYTKVTAANDFSFAYLEDNDKNTAGAAATASDINFSSEAKICFDGIQDLRREAMRQRMELTTAISLLESKLSSQCCQACGRNNIKLEMVDKSLETDESLNMHDMKYNNSNAAENICTEATEHLNIIQEKIAADALERACPMCGRTFGPIVSFAKFCEHVETHFIEEDQEESLINNYELISHTVGNF